jgi:hypothetical protein
MATSLGDLLDALTDQGSAAAEHPRSRADAGTALGHLGRALTQLKIDGVSAQVGDNRERRVAVLGSACTALAARAPVADGRMTALAGAAADAIAMLRNETTMRTRWAAAVAIVDAVDTLAALLENALPAGPAAQWLHEIRSHAVQIDRDAAQDPPTQRDAAVLDRPIPAFADTSNRRDGAQIVDATAALLHATRKGTAPLTIAAVLAATLAAQSLSETGNTLLADTAEGDDVTNAALAWQAIRSVLQPFNDGTRIPHPDASAAVSAARSLHRHLRRLADRPEGGIGELQRAAVASAVQYLPMIASNLKSTVTAWGVTGTALAHARDLPVREHTLPQYLAGYRTKGLIHADRFDLAPVTDAVHRAQLLSTALAAALSSVAEPDAAGRTNRARGNLHRASSGAVAVGPSTRRLSAHNRAFLDEAHTAARLSAARQAAYRQVHAPHPPTAARRGR